MANRTVTTLTAVLQMNNTKFKKGLTGSQKALKVFQNQVKAIGGMIAGAFAVGTLVNFGREAIQVAMKAEGIRTAFERLNRPDLLDNLKKATRDTVSEINLMQAAVRAENFKIPLERLGTFFQFATDRAIQTGESVDYLVNSIIDGIGRKSTLVLDNLGISASDLQAEMKKTGDFGQAAANIIQREMEKAGEVMSTAAIKAGQLRATFENLKETTGTGLLSALGLVVDALKFKFNPEQWATEQAARAVAEAFEDQAKALGEVDGRVSAVAKAYKLMNEQQEKRNKLAAEHARLMATVKKPNAGPTLTPEAEAFYGNYLGAFDKNFQIATRPEMDPTTDALKTNASLMEYFYEMMDELDEEIQDSVGSETFAKVDKVNNSLGNLGNTVGIQLVSQFDSLGEAIGKTMAGADDAMQDLGKTILQNLGNILIMAGMQSGNIPLVLLGAAMQLGSGIINGLGSEGGSSSNRMGNSSVSFGISGRSLTGVMQRNDKYRTYAT